MRVCWRERSAGRRQYRAPDEAQRHPSGLRPGVYAYGSVFVDPDRLVFISAQYGSE